MTKRATLVMFSSGVDSTYSLVKLLRETDDEIYAHHIHLINPEQRHLVEAQQSRLIAKHCAKTIRPFKYSESAIDHRRLRWFGFDIMAVGFEAGIVAHSFFKARKRRMDRWTIGTCVEEGHWEERFAHVKNCLAANCFPHDPPDFFLLPLVPKAEEAAYLGKEILDMCWTCRRPIRTGETQLTECGRCKTCVEMQKVRAAVGQKPGTPDTRSIEGAHADSRATQLETMQEGSR